MSQYRRLGVRYGLHKVFVFGTLKQGFPNFSTNKGVRYRQDFETQQSYPLYLVGERYSPWLILHPGQGHKIKGQVFEVSDATLAAMDALERIHEKDGYRKVQLEVTCLTTRESLSVMAYGKSPDGLDVKEVKQELMGEYQLEHAKLYRRRVK